MNCLYSKDPNTAIGWQYCPQATCPLMLADFWRWEGHRAALHPNVSRSIDFSLENASIASKFRKSVPLWILDECPRVLCAPLAVKFISPTQGSRARRLLGAFRTKSRLVPLTPQGFPRFVPSGPSSLFLAVPTLARAPQATGPVLSLWALPAHPHAFALRVSA